MKNPYRVILNVKGNPWIPSFENYITQIENTVMADSMAEKLRLIKLINHIDMLIQDQTEVVNLIESTLQGMSIDQYLLICAQARDGNSASLAKIEESRKDFAQKLESMSKKQRKAAQDAIDKLLPSAQAYAKNVKSISRRFARELSSLSRTSPNTPITQLVARIRQDIEKEYAKTDEQKRQLDTFTTMFASPEEYATGIKQLQSIGEKLVLLDKQHSVNLIRETLPDGTIRLLVKPMIDGQPSTDFQQFAANGKSGEEVVGEQLSQIIGANGKLWKFVSETRKNAQGEYIEGARQKQEFLSALDKISAFLLSNGSAANQQDTESAARQKQWKSRLSTILYGTIKNLSTTENSSERIGISNIFGTAPATQEEKEQIETYSQVGLLQETVKMAGAMIANDKNFVQGKLKTPSTKKAVARAVTSALNTGKRNIERVEFPTTTITFDNDILQGKQSKELSDVEIARISDNAKFQAQVRKVTQDADEQHSKTTTDWKNFYTYIQKTEDKVDEFVRKVYRNADNKKVEFFLAYSDKLYNRDHLDDISINSGSLASNKDLFLNDTAGSGDLVFYALNQAAASAFAGHGNLDTKQMESLINTLIFGSVAEQMFDTRAFQRMEKSRNRHNVLYIFNVNNMYIPLLTILKEIRDNLENADQIVSTEFKFDTTTDAAQILAVARAQYGYSVDATGTIHDSEEAWAFVAAQVAARTKFDVKFHTSFFTSNMLNI